MAWVVALVLNLIDCFWWLFGLVTLGFSCAFVAMFNSVVVLHDMICLVF